MARQLKGEEPVLFGRKTAMGSQAYYISHADPAHFQPMNANFGLFELTEKCRKKDRKDRLAANALERIQEVAKIVNADWEGPVFDDRPQEEQEETVQPALNTTANPQPESAQAANSQAEK